MKRSILFLCLLFTYACARAPTRPRIHAPTRAHVYTQETNLFWNENFKTWHNDQDACFETIVNNNPEKLKLVNRMAGIIHRYKIKHDRGQWIECGKKIKNETKTKRRAWDYAWEIVDASENISDDKYTLIPWSLTAIYANESVFDICALGPGPRKWAYRRGLLKKRHILSHYKKDVVKVITDKVAKRVFGWSGFDLGPCQLLSKYYKGDPLDMINVRRGSQICAQEAYNRGQRHEVKQPQLLWPNGRKDSRRAKKYRRWVNSRLRRMGVTTEEMFNDNLYYKKTIEG